MAIIQNDIVLAMAYFPLVETKISSALECLTSEFEMGSGVTTPLKSPEQCHFVKKLTLFKISFLKSNKVLYGS